MILVRKEIQRIMEKNLPEYWTSCTFKTSIQNLMDVIVNFYNKKYCDLFISDNKYDNKTLLSSNFFTVLYMFVMKIATMEQNQKLIWF